MTTRSSALRHPITPSLRGALFYLSFFLSAGAYGPFLNVYYKDLGLSGQQIGLLSTCFPLMTLFFAPLLSALADRRNRRVLILQTALVIGAVFIFLLQFPQSFGWIALVLFLMAIAFGPVMSIADGLIADMAQRRGLNYGGMRLWGSIGFSTSAMIFGWVYQEYALVSMFAISAVLLLPVIWVAGGLEESRVQAQERGQTLTVILRDAGLAVSIAVSFLAGIANAVSMSFEGILVQHLGGSNFTVGFTIGIAGVGEILTMQFGQRITERFSKINALILSIGIWFLAFLLYLLAPQAWMLIPAAVLRGLGFGLFFPTIVRLVNERAPGSWVATAQSFRTVAMFGIAPLLTGPLAGLAHDRLSPSAPYGLGVVALGLGMALLAWAAARRIFT